MKYDLLTDADIEALAVCTISSDSTRLVFGSPCPHNHLECDRFLNHASLNTLCDRRMGPCTRSERCATCDGDVFQCLGHPARIELCEPVFLIHFVKPILTVLQKLCSACLKQPIKSPVCPLGGGPCSTQKMVARYVEGLVLVKRNGTDEYWSARRVRQVLREVVPNERLGPSPLEGIRTTLYVTPTLFRPYRKIPGYAYKADGLTDLYAKIVHANKKLVAFETRDSRLRGQVCFRCAQSYQHLY